MPGVAKIMSALATAPKQWELCTDIAACAVGAEWAVVCVTFQHKAVVVVAAQHCSAVTGCIKLDRRKSTPPHPAVEHDCFRSRVTRSSLAAGSFRCRHASRCQLSAFELALHQDQSRRQACANLVCTSASATRIPAPRKA